MDLSQLPIHERLDALINRLDNSDSDSGADNEDYHQFVDRQAAQDLAKVAAAPAPPPETEDTAAQVEQYSDLEFGSDLGPEFSDVDAFSDEPAGPAPQSTHAEIIGSIYADAGLEPDPSSGAPSRARSGELPPEGPGNPAGRPGAKPRRRTPKQIQRDREEAARNDRRLERELVPEIGTRTAKAFPVTDFLSDLFADDSGADNGGAAKPSAKILSSPPRPPPLTRFVGTPKTPRVSTERGTPRNEASQMRNTVNKPRNEVENPRSEVNNARTEVNSARNALNSPHIDTSTQTDKDAQTNAQATQIDAQDTQIDAQDTQIDAGNAPLNAGKARDPADASDDSDLEIIPTTKTSQMSRPVRDLLKLVGSSAGGTPAARRMAAERRKLALLEQQQSHDRVLQYKERLAAQGVDVDAVATEIAAHQRQRAGGADLLLAHERQNAEQLRALEAEASDSEASADSGDEATPIVRRKILSDDEDDDTNEDEDKTPGNRSKNSSLCAPTTENGNTTEKDDSNEKDNTKNEPSGTDHMGAPRAHKFATDLASTQYVQPVSPSVLADIMELDQPGAGPEDTLRDPSQTGALDLSEFDEPLEIVRNDTVRLESVTPDLTGLNRLPPEQRLAKVRQRYLEAKAEQRRQEYFAEQQQQQQQRPRRAPNAFVEDQAEESEDESPSRIPRFGDDDEDDEDNDGDDDADLEDLVDRNTAVKVDAGELKRRFLEEEKLRDQKLLNKFVDGVHGGFRRRRHRAQTGDQFLSDDDLAFSDEETNHRLLVEAKRKNGLLRSNQQVAQLAANQRAAAFFTSISEDLVSRPQGKRGSIQEGLDFLRSFDQAERRIGSVSDVTDLASDHDYPGAELPLPSGSAQPRPVRVTRPKTILERSQQIVKSGTYASRIASADLGGPRHPGLTASLGRPRQPHKPKARFVAPPVNLPTAKRRPLIATKLTKHSWD